LVIKIIKNFEETRIVESVNRELGNADCYGGMSYFQLEVTK